MTPRRYQRNSREEGRNAPQDPDHAANRDLLGVAVVVSLLGCGGGTDPDPNQRAVGHEGEIPDRQMTEGDTVTFDRQVVLFSDPDGDSLTYAAVASNARCALRVGFGKPADPDRSWRPAKRRSP